MMRVSNKTTKHIWIMGERGTQFLKAKIGLVMIAEPKVVKRVMSNYKFKNSKHLENFLKHQF